MSPLSLPTALREAVARETLEDSIQIHPERHIQAVHSRATPCYEA